MKCQKCFKDFPEKEIELSHDIPKYIGGTDKDGRHWICIKCHIEYELMILSRCFIFIYNKIIPYSIDRRDYINYIYQIKKEPDKLKQSKFWNIAQQVKSEVWNVGFS